MKCTIRTQITHLMLNNVMEPLIRKLPTRPGYLKQWTFLLGYNRLNLENFFPYMMQIIQINSILPEIKFCKNNNFCKFCVFFVFIL